MLLSSPRCHASIGALQLSFLSGWHVPRKNCRGTRGYSNARSRPSSHGPAAGGFELHARAALRPTSYSIRSTNRRRRSQSLCRRSRFAGSENRMSHAVAWYTMLSTRRCRMEAASPVGGRSSTRLVAVRSTGRCRPFFSSAFTRVWIAARAVRTCGISLIRAIATPLVAISVRSPGRAGSLNEGFASMSRRTRRATKFLAISLSSPARALVMMSVFFSRSRSDTGRAV